jgi:opacity protein-like surface antigen
VRGVKALAVCCAVLGAQGAAAQEGAQEAEPRLAARWSVGAGLGYSGFTLVGGSLGIPGLLGTSGGLSGLAGRTSLEYLLGENLALVLGASGSYARATSETEGEVVPREPQTAYGFSANVGLRGFVASAGATRFSVYGLLNAGATHRDEVTSAMREERTRSFYVSAGFGVDHQLLERLSVRVSADMLSVGHSTFRQTLGSSTGEPDTVSHSDVTSATLFLAPSLELRLAF